MKVDANELFDGLRAEFTDPKLKEIATKLGAQATVLGARALIGEDVSVELAHVRAQAAMLTAEEVATVRRVTLEWISGVFTKVALAALATS